MRARVRAERPQLRRMMPPRSRLQVSRWLVRQHQRAMREAYPHLARKTMARPKTSLRRKAMLRLSWKSKPKRKR